MTRVLVWIAEPSFARLRADEIGIGHDSELIVALSETPIVARLEEVVGQLQQYWGPEGSVAIEMRPEATPAGIAAYHAGSQTGAAHGLAWEVIDDRSADELATLPWFDQDERSIYLAAEILAGRLSNATEEERDLAVSWTAFVEGLSPERPRYGIRELPFRAEQRELLFELATELRAYGDAPREWSRLGATRTLADGSVLVVENVSSDGGIYPTWYCVSRYRGGRRLRDLIERSYL